MLYLKTAIGLILLAVIVVPSANALVRCDIDYTIDSAALVGELGGGSGTVKCWDKARNMYATPIGVAMAGGGVKVGFCEAKGHIRAVGVGFTIAEILDGIGQVEVGSMFLAKKSAAGGVRIGLGLNIEVVGNRIKYSGPCFGLASAQYLQTWAAGRTLSARPRRSG